jgi:hypothetical protein
MPLVKGMILDDPNESRQSMPKYHSSKDSSPHRNLDSLKGQQSFITQKESMASLSKMNLTNNLSMASGELFRNRNGIMANDFPSMNSHGSLVAGNFQSGKKSNDYTPLMNNLADIANKLEKSVNNQHNRINQDLADIHKELTLIKNKDPYKDDYLTKNPSPKNARKHSPIHIDNGQSHISPKGLIDIFPKSLMDKKESSPQKQILPRNQAGTEKTELTPTRVQPKIDKIDIKEEPRSDPKTFIKAKETLPASFGKVRKKSKQVTSRKKGLKRKREEIFPENGPKGADDKK